MVRHWHNWPHWTSAERCVAVVVCWSDDPPAAATAAAARSLTVIGKISLAEPLQQQQATKRLKSFVGSKRCGALRRDAEEMPEPSLTCDWSLQRLRGNS